MMRLGFPMLMASLACPPGSVASPGGSAPAASGTVQPIVFAQVLEAVANASRRDFRVDPRVLRQSSPADDTASLVPLDELQLEAHRRAIARMGLEVGDFFRAYACDSAGTLTVTQGQDTLIYPMKPPPPDDCLPEHSELVLIQRLPVREEAGKRVDVHIIGGGSGQEWTAYLDEHDRVQRVELVFAWST